MRIFPETFATTVEVPDSLPPHPRADAACNIAGWVLHSLSDDGRGRDIAWWPGMLLPLFYFSGCFYHNGSLVLVVCWSPSLRNKVL